MDIHLSFGTALAGGNGNFPLLHAKYTIPDPVLPLHEITISSNVGFGTSPGNTSLVSDIRSIPEGSSGHFSLRDADNYPFWRSRFTRPRRNNTNLSFTLVSVPTNSTSFTAQQLQDIMNAELPVRVPYVLAMYKAIVLTEFSHAEIKSNGRLSFRLRGHLSTLTASEEAQEGPIIGGGGAFKTFEFFTMRCTLGFEKTKAGASDVFFNVSLDGFKLDFDDIRMATVVGIASFFVNIQDIVQQNIRTRLNNAIERILEENINGITGISRAQRRAATACIIDLRSNADADEFVFEVMAGIPGAIGLRTGCLGNLVMLAGGILFLLMILIRTVF